MILVALAVVVFIASYLVMSSQQPDSIQSAASGSEQACLTSTHEPGFDYNDCLEKAPTWAERPGWYSAAIAAGFLVIGRGYLFMRRLESRDDGQP
jgi:hypothetical protein